MGLILRKLIIVQIIMKFLIVCVCVCVCVYTVYIHTYTHTYTHTYIFFEEDEFSHMIRRACLSVERSSYTPYPHFI